MKYAIILLTITLCAATFATPFLSGEEYFEARAHIEAHLAEKPPVAHSALRPAEMPQWQTFPRFSYPHELTELVDFWRTWQLLDPDSAEHGGIIEAESGDLRDVIQTDNTQEVVWDWAYYIAHAADSSFFENIDSAWVYLSNFPAYNEELSELSPTFTSYYYRVWNSALGLLMEMGLRDMLGDSSHLPYADSCADVVVADWLPLSTPWPEIDGLHALVNGFAAGCLYKYGIDRGRSELCDTALVIADAVQEWIDRAPDSSLSYIDWAMSGGTIVWGMMNSRFAAMPESLDAWLIDYGPTIPDYIEPPDDYDALIWDNSWNIWLANGFRAVWNATGDSTYYIKYRTILDGLLVQDGDGDGGIPASAAGPDIEDMTWISAYILLYAMDWVIDSLPALDAGALNPTVYMPKGWATADDTVYIVAQVASFGDDPAGEVDFNITLDRGIILDTIAHFGWGEAFPIDTFAIIPGFEGDHVVGIQTLLSDAESWNDTAGVHFEATAVRNLSGTISDTASATPIEAKLYFTLLLEDTSYLYDSTESGAAGGYTIDLPCFAFDVEIEPEFPFWGESFDSVIVDAAGCNLRNFALERADMVVVEDDMGGDYLDYYVPCFDTIGATYRFWNRDSIGPVPESVSGEMRHHTVLWFTGDDTSATLDSTDIAALTYIIENGGNVLLTGQGLMEDLHDDAGFAALIHADWISDDGAYLMAGVPGDPISGDFGSIMLLGGTGAGNQHNQDRIAPVAPAEGFLTYSTGTGYAAVRFQHPTSGGKMVYCAFGIEGVPYPAISEAYTDRVELLEAILKWFDPTYEIAENTLPEKLSMRTWPNPFNSSVTISLSVIPGSTRNPEIEIFDINGRMVENMAVGDGSPVPSATGRGDLAPTQIVWMPLDNLGSGVYLVRAKIGDETTSKRIVYLK